jgi:hypothetical protein
MTNASTEQTDSDATDDTDSPNISRLREMAIRGKQYRETLYFDYYTAEDEPPLELVVRPLDDTEFLPIGAVLEDKLDLDPEEAQEKLDEADEAEDGGIDPSEFDEEFIEVMQEAAVMGIDTTQGAAEGEDEQGVREILGATDDDDDIGLQGGATLLIAEAVLDISSDSEAADSFRRDGGGK